MQLAVDLCGAGAAGWRWAVGHRGLLARVTAARAARNHPPVPWGAVSLQRTADGCL